MSTGTVGPVSDNPPPSADDFDEWYAGMVAAPAKDEIVQRHLGLPPDLLSSSLLPIDGIAEVTAALRLAPGAVLVDLACGRGGYGAEIARRSKTRLIGIDFSAEAVRQARSLSHGTGAEFHIGRLNATGLDAASVDGLMCVDAIQFSTPLSAALDEVFRVLRPGGRVALTSWEALDRGDKGVPERLRGLDLSAGLAAAGFIEVTVEERAEWQERELAMWREAAALDPGEDAALRSLHEEGVHVLARGRTRRVIATATRP